MDLIYDFIKENPVLAVLSYWTIAGIAFAIWAIKCTRREDNEKKKHTEG
jgi:hypothetical protein